MTIVENGVNYNVKRYNDLRVINERLVRDLKARLDELEYEKKSFISLIKSEVVSSLKKKANLISKSNKIGEIIGESNLPDLNSLESM